MKNQDKITTTMYAHIPVRDFNGQQTRFQNSVGREFKIGIQQSRSMIGSGNNLKWWQDGDTHANQQKQQENKATRVAPKTMTPAAGAKTGKKPQTSKSPKLLWKFMVLGNDYTCTEDIAAANYIVAQRKLGEKQQQLKDSVTRNEVFIVVPAFGG